MTKVNNNTNKPFLKVIQFVIVGLVLYLVWDFLYWRFIYVHPVTGFLRDIQTQAAAWCLHGIGLNAYAHQKFLYINGVKSVMVADQCNGLDFFGVFVCFILAYPVSYKAKLWFLPIGFCIVFGMNVLRIMALALNYHWSKGSFEFNHKITFTYLVYGAVFGCWYLWISWYFKKKEVKTAMVAK